MRALLFAVVSAAALVACASNPSGAASPTIAAAAPAQVEITAPSGEYALDLSHASVLFRVQHLGLSYYTARFNKFDSTLTFNQADPAASSIVVTLDPNSVETGLESARPGKGAAFNAEIGAALGGQPVTFRSTSVTRTGPATGKVTGDLTMNGQTKPLTLDVTFYGSRNHPFNQKPMMGFAARGTLDRSQWGITKWEAFTGTNVELVIEAEYIKS